MVALVVDESEKSCEGRWILSIPFSGLELCRGSLMPALTSTALLSATGEPYKGYIGMLSTWSGVCVPMGMQLDPPGDRHVLR